MRLAVAYALEEGRSWIGAQVEILDRRAKSIRREEGHLAGYRWACKWRSQRPRFLEANLLEPPL